MGSASARVLIAGAGPAGASLALLLARQGIAVELVEASPSFSRQFRGDALMPSGLEALELMGLLPLPESVHQRPLRGWSFWLEGRALFEVAEPMDSARPCMLVHQGELLEALVAEVARQPGAHLLSGRPIVGLLRHQGRVSGVELSDGTQLRADLVVACDGRHSLLRQQAELELEEQPAQLDVLWFHIAASASDELSRWLQGRFVTIVGGGCSFALFEAAAGGVQLGWALEPGGLRPQPASWPEFWAARAPHQVAASLRGIPPAAVRGPVHLPVRVGLARSWHVPGLLLLGDAAHPMSPLRAQGINMALRDALTAGRQLLPLLRQGDGDALDAGLAAVAASRLPEIKRMQALQRREALRAERLQGQGWLRGLLASSAPWSGPWLARHWSADQRQLRSGLAETTAMMEAIAKLPWSGNAPVAPP